MATEAPRRSIYISYRRNSAADAGRIYDRLVARFGQENAFMDVDSIPAGADFNQYLDEYIQKQGVVIAIIGPDWAHAMEASGGILRRERADFVRIELETALQHEIPVIPVLVNGASMPTTRSLPPNLQPLAYRNGLEISYDRFDEDVNRLLDVLEQYVGSPAPSETLPQQAAKMVAQAAFPDQTDEAEADVPRGGHLFLFQPPEKLIGREREIQILDSAWEGWRLLVLYGPAGIGKTALVSAWLNQQALRGWRGVESAFGWSFTYNQSVHDFFTSAIQFFGDKPTSTSVAPAALGIQLAQILISRKSILILDGLESLQESAGTTRGRVIDESLATLLVTLAVRNAGLCILTSRERLSGLKDLPLSEIAELSIARISTDAAVSLLKSIGLHGTDTEFIRMVETYNGNPGMLANVAAHLISGNIRDVPDLKELENIDELLKQVRPEHEAADSTEIASTPTKPLFKPTFASFESDLVAFDPTALKKPLVDSLGVERYASHLAQLIAADKTPLPLSIGLFGDWGSGKSYFLRLLHQQVDGLTTNSSKAFCRKIVQIHFNAWHYLDTNLWANLVCEIFDELFNSLTDRADTSNDKVEELKKQLGESSALAAEAREALRAAEEARDAAEESLRTKQAERTQQERTVAGFIDDLGKVLVDDDELKEQLKDLASAFGFTRVDKSFSELEARAIEARTLGGRVKAMGLAIFTGPQRGRQIGLLVLALLVPIALGFLVPRLLQLGNTEWATIVRATTQLAALIGALSAWLSVQLKRGAAIVNKLETTYDEVQTVREKQRRGPKVLKAQQELDLSLKKEADARHALEDAEAKVRSIESELRELAPGRRLFRFLEDRSRAADYRQHLGLVSLVRRDFEQLSRLLRESEEFKEGDQPMLDRIVLYIDDLDRCRSDRVIQVLEAVHLLLAFPLFAVVVAVDPRWLRRSLLEHYPNLIGARVNGTAKRGAEPSERQASPQDYLEKIFQVPFHLQCLEKDGFNKLTSKLFSTRLAETAKQQQPRPPSEPNQGPAPQPADITAAQAATSQARAGVKTPPTKRVSPPPPPAPERLQLESWEVSAVQQCHSLFHTPRAVKRLANTYCLVRVGIEAEEWDAFLGSEEQPGSYRTPLLLLAVCSAFPSIGRQWMNALKTRECKTWIPTDKELTQIMGPEVPAGISEQWDGLRRGLKHMEAAKFVELDPETTPLWVSRVERYSF